MDQRLLFVQMARRRERSMTELCEAFEISRKTGYKWLERFDGEGPVGLRDRSRAPLSHPHAVDRSVTDLILELRRERPTWGPRKLLAFLEPKWPDLSFPCHATVSNLLRRAGLAASQSRRRKWPAPSPGPLGAGIEQPNAIWGADFKGWFLTGDRKRCTPFTVSDLCSRYFLCCSAVNRTDFTIVRYWLSKTFEEHGLPESLRTDNGPPFASPAPGGISRLAVWLIRLGVRPERIQPGKPTQNGRHERIHRTLAAETANPPKRNRLAQQLAFDEFRLDYNTVRPHESLGQRPPASAYCDSPRRYPKLPREPEYSEEWDVCRVRNDGSFRFTRFTIDLPDFLAGADIGLRETTEHGWDVFYGHVRLGILKPDGRFLPC